MPGQILIDNWTLQNAGELLHHKLTDDTGHELVISEDGQTFSYVDIPENVIAFESLAQLLQNVVFGEQLLVDAQFADAWSAFDALSPLKAANIIVGKPFRESASEWQPRAPAMEDYLCFCPQIRAC